MTIRDDMILTMVKASTEVWDTWPEAIDLSNQQEVKIAAMTAALAVALDPEWDQGLYPPRPMTGFLDGLTDEQKIGFGLITMAQKGLT